MRVYLGRKPEQLLEAYEHNGLIMPFYRVHIPENYKKIRFKYEQCPDQKKSNFLPKKYKEIHDFICDRLANYSASFSPWIERTLADGHPLDWAFNEGKSYLEKPSNKTFKPWPDYKVMVGKLNGYPQTDSTAEHFYAQWQIFIVEEANRLFSISITPYIPFNFFDMYLPNKNKLSLIEWSDEFEVVAEYRFRKEMLLGEYMGQSSVNILEGAPLESYLREIKLLSDMVFAKLPEERWITFLKKLCEVYFLYEESEKIILSKFLKKHIYSVIKIYLKSTGALYYELVTKVGNDIDGTTYFYNGPLERIFPDEEKEKIRDSKKHLICLKDNYNSLSVGSNLSNLNIDEIIEEAISQGNDTLLTKIIELQKEWFEGNAFRHDKIWSHIRSLATAVESFGRGLFPRANGLSNCIDKANGQYQSLKRPFDNHVREIIENDPSINVESIINAQSPQEFLEKIDIIDDYSKKGITIPAHLSDLRFLLRGHLIRNFVNHSTKIDGKFFGRLFLTIYKSLIFTVFYLYKNK